MTTRKTEKWPTRPLTDTERAVLREADSKARTQRGQRDAIVRFIEFWLDRDPLRTKVLLMRDAEAGERLMQDALAEATKIPF